MGEVATNFRNMLSDLEGLTATLPDATDGKEFTGYHFAPGVYLREFLLPAGMYFTTKIHNSTHLLIVANGSTKIVSEKGSEVIHGPAVLTTYPGTKRAVYGITDTTFYTVHVTEETDVDKIEEHIMAKTFEDVKLIEGSTT